MSLKIAVVTAGAVGAYFGGRLIQQGVAVSFLARGAHLVALKDRGLKARSVDGDFELYPSQYLVTDQPDRAVEGADLVLFAVKSFDTYEIARSMLPGLKPETVVISLQNGVENEPLLSEILGPERIAAGAAYIEVTLAGPGAIQHRRVSRIVISEKTEGGTPVPKLDELKRSFEKAGITFEIAQDSLTLKWSKLIFISTFSGWTTAARRPINQILADPELAETFRATALETAQVAKAAGARLEPDKAVESVMTLVGKLGDMNSSMAFDFEQGKQIEVEAINGIVVRKGRELGIATPYNQALYALLSALQPLQK